MIKKHNELNRMQSNAENDSEDDVEEVIKTLEIAD